MRACAWSTTAIGVALAVTGMLLNARPCAGEVEFPGPAPGTAVAQADGDEVSLGNNVLRMAWRVSGGVLRPVSIEDKIAGTTLALEQAECFQLVLAKTPLARNSGSAGIRIAHCRNARAPGSRQPTPSRCGWLTAKPVERSRSRLASADGAIEVELAGGTARRVELRSSSHQLSVDREGS